MRNRHLLAKTTDKKSRAIQGLDPMALELPLQLRGHQRTNTFQAVPKNQFHLLSHKPSLDVPGLNGTAHFQYSQLNGPAAMLNQALGQQAIQKSLAFAKNQADHIVAEAQSLKSRQISRGLVKINQSKYQLQKLEK